jgi:hypothetical protein
MKIRLGDVEGLMNRKLKLCYLALSEVEKAKVRVINESL